jgi:hypothetical protein
VGYDSRELENELVPMVRKEFLAKQKAGDWAEEVIAACRKELSLVLPLNAQEMDFLDRILDHGEIRPELLATDATLSERIKTHPLLLWKAQNARQFKGR